MQSISRLILRHQLRSLGPIGLTALQSPVYVLTCTAFFSSSSHLQSGHNRWSKIRHDKGKNDANKSAEFSRLSQEICSAVKNGGPSPDNLRLSAALAAAKKVGMSKDKMEAAVKRGQGVSASGAALEQVHIECIGPGSVAMIIECQTDNKLGCLAGIKVILRKNGATVTPTSYLFARKGILRLSTGDNSYDTLLESCLEIDGMEDINEIEPGEKGPKVEVEVTADPAKTVAVAEGLKSRLSGVEILKSSIGWVPKEETLVSVDDEKVLEALIKLINILEEMSDVGEVYTNIK
ncbi:transcriptional regulator TACO1-like protein [Tuber borchii]|uniref:Transcriptional regulator TACO1-like protein n=1 Tax=Tuber borchii TaxID=42251 RepID=A0A2T6ZRM4_TUBBO|nr:transcriptional regulator TACO1-like protein [Tuber borchii]